MDVRIQALEPNFICIRVRGDIRNMRHWRSDDPLNAFLGPEGWPGNVVLDLQEAEFIDSEGIAWLMHWNQRARKAGGAFGVCSVPARIEPIFRICQLHRVMSIWENEAAARAALGAVRGPT